MTERISKYDLIEPIGESVVGTVYRARDQELERPVAIEVLPDGRDERRRKARLASAQQWSRLSHPNLATIYDLGAEGERCFIAMELPEGRNLGDLLAARPDLPIEEKIAILMQLCAGLHYAHSHGVIHGDIKPSNITVLEDGTVKLADLRIVDPADRRYAAPEQEALFTDELTDQYSLAAVFEDLLAIAPLVGADAFLRSLGAVRASVAGGGADPELPSDLVQIIARAMSRDPRKRYADLHKLRAELGDLLERLALRSWRDGATMNSHASSALTAWRMTPKDIDLPALAKEQVARARDWGRANVGLVTLSLLAVVSLTAAALTSPSHEPDRPVIAATSKPVSLPASMAAATRTAPVQSSNLDPATRTTAESARDAALAARFRSAKSESTHYVPDLHLAAQRKELEGDAAFRKHDFRSAKAFYELARDGYEIAASRAEFSAASIEKARIDAQLAAEAAARNVSMRQYPSYATTAPREGSAPPSQAPIKPLIIEPGSDAYLTLQPPRPDDPGALKETTRVSGNPLARSFAAVFTEPSDGSRNGGTWGACWRSDPDAAKACARATCEERGGRRCVEVATSRPGEHCVVAKASGYGISSGACRSGQREAEAAALAGCRQEISGQYGSGAATCRIAWSSAG